ncbi:hypothetical protein B0H11DRAFT_1908113 [Mycena galericulata]|nr:hypothetical protein B0H11DRAFT_1908113 [Mycena galericulata]
MTDALNSLLCVSTLKGLPPSVRPKRRRMVESLQSLIRIGEIVQDLQLPGEKAELLLPVFYSNLAVDGIPTAENWTQITAVPLGHRFCFPTGAGWNSSTYREYLTWCDPPPVESEVCRNFTIFIAHFHTKTSEVLLSAPGFRFMMVRARALSVQNEKSAAYYTKMCWIIFRHLECWDGWDPQNLLDAAGGSIYQRNESRATFRGILGAGFQP